MNNTNVLQLLSRQHNEDGKKCRHLLKEIQQQGNKETVKEEILTFWKQDLQKHVDAEERVLLPFLVKNRFNYEFINVLKREHDTIRLLAQRLPFHNDGYHIYKAFIKLVDQHTHFEDEIVFRKMKEDIAVQELENLDRSMQAYA
jgi:iron-sulfur cluster repair protein YtfE (RIC family)